jgi:3',5'-cyclic AMP phosphodiesterase CpdA
MKNDHNDFETTLHVNGLEKEFSVMHITDSHISFDDKNDEAYIQYSARMKEAFIPGTQKHIKTGKPCDSLGCFEEILETAKKKKAEHIILTGDIINYPSQNAVLKIIGLLDRTGIPWVYTAGNHDWCIFQSHRAMSPAK